MLWEWLCFPIISSLSGSWTRIDQLHISQSSSAKKYVTIVKIDNHAFNPL